MHITDAFVTDRNREFREVWRMLAETHRPRPEGEPPAVNAWSANRFEGWVVYSAPDWFNRAALNRKLHLWREDTDNLVGLAIVEGSGRDFHVITHPDHREIEPDILTWVEGHWPSAGGTWITYAEAGDECRETVLAGLGYRAEGESETMHAYDLLQVSGTVTLPEGYAIRDAVVDPDRVARSRLTSLVFHPDRDPDLTPEPVMQEMWSYDPALDLVVVAPDGQRVAFATGSINRVNGLAEVEPVGTHPAYRRLGLARAVVTACLNDLRERGARWAYIASAPEPSPANRFYVSLNPVAQQHFVRWEKATTRS